MDMETLRLVVDRIVIAVALSLIALLVTSAILFTYGRRSKRGHPR